MSKTGPVNAGNPTNPHPPNPDGEGEEVFKARTISQHISSANARNFARWKSPKVKQSAIVGQCLEYGFELLNEAKKKVDQGVHYALPKQLQPIFDERMAYNRDKDIKGYDAADDAALVDLEKLAKKHPKIAQHLEECAMKIHGGVFTDINIDWDVGGKKRLARMDGDDAAQILATAARKKKFAERKAQLQAEWKAIDEAEAAA